MGAKKKQNSKTNMTKRQLEAEATVDSQPSKKRKVEKQAVELAMPDRLGGRPGVVLVCGCGDAGQLGLGNEVMEKFLPAVLPNLPQIVDVQAGGMHNLLLTVDGQVWSFGCNDDGALGRPSSDETDCVPESVKLPNDQDGNPPKIVQISAGDSHSAALTSTGKVYAWGIFRDANGKMGLKSSEPADRPLHQPVLMLDDPKIVVTAIASGDNHLVCLTSTGEVLTCGCAEQGQLGRVSQRNCTLRDNRMGPPTLLELRPLQPPRGGMKFSHIWAGSFSTVLCTSKGQLLACGLNNYSQLGSMKLPKDVLSSYFPTKLESFSGVNWKDISGGPHHTLALTEEGEVRCVGRKEYGRLGLGEDCEDQPAPASIPGLQGKVCTSISSGVACSFAVSSEGEAYCWGQAGSNLGLGDIDEDMPQPALVKGKNLANHHVVQVSAGGQHTLYLAYSKS